MSWLATECFVLLCFAEAKLELRVRKNRSELCAHSKPQDTHTHLRLDCSTAMREKERAVNMNSSSNDDDDSDQGLAEPRATSFGRETDLHCRQPLQIKC